MGSWAKANELSDNSATQQQSAFFICKFDAVNAIFMVPNSQARGQAELQKRELAAFESKEILLNRQAAAVTDQLAVAADHAMAGDHDRNGI